MTAHDGFMGVIGAMSVMSAASIDDGPVQADSIRAALIDEALLDGFASGDFPIGVIVIASIAAIATAFWLVRVRARSRLRREALEVQADAAAGEVPFERRGRSRFLLPALLFVVFNTVSVIFFAWAPVFRELDWSGIRTILIFSLPILVGLAYQWRMRALEW